MSRRDEDVRDGDAGDAHEKHAKEEHDVKDDPTHYKEGSEIKFRSLTEPEPEDNHERWLISYADFITLMFAFFVVMYATAVQDTSNLQTSQQKAAQLSSTVMEAFNQTDAKGNPVFQEDTSEQVRKIVERAARARKMASELRALLEPMERAGQVRLTEGAHGIDIEINAKALFKTGEADIAPRAAQILKRIGAILATGDFPVNVEGHTDNVPISTAHFPSNWELSSARASSVVRILIEAGTPAELMKASGYADQRPAADNATEEGRARNRRVAILIEAKYD